MKFVWLHVSFRDRALTNKLEKDPCPKPFVAFRTGMLPSPHREVTELFCDLTSEI